MRTCTKCKHYHASLAGEDGDCRFNPPTVFLVFDKQKGVQFVSKSAPVNADHWCGQFEPHISLVS